MSRALSTGLVAGLLLLSAPLGVLAQTPDIPDDPPAPPAEAQPQEEKPAAAEPEKKVEAEAPAKKTRSTTTKRSGKKAAAAEEGSARKTATAARLAPTPLGETGLIRVAAADSLRPGLIRLTFGLDFFSVGSFFRPDDGASRVGGTLSVSGSPIDHLELWLSTRAQSTSNALTNPQLLQAMGDLRLGVKGFYTLADVVTIGADAQLGFLSGIGESSFDLGSSEVTLRALLTGDLTRMAEPLPVRAHLNAGVIVDNSHNLLGNNGLSNAERFALGISDFSRFGIGVGVEVPVKYVTPFLEYSVELPFGYLATPGVIIGAASALSPAQTGPGPAVRTCTPTDDSSCARPAWQKVVPQRLTPGVRVTAIPDLTLDVALEIGLTPAIATGVLAVPDYNFYMVASYAFDPFHDAVRGPPIAVPVIVPEVTEVAPKITTGEVGGVVKMKGGTELAGAVVSIDRSTPVATAANGFFKSHPVEPGPVVVTVSKDGFETATVKADVTAGTVAAVNVELVQAVREGVVRGRVVDDKDKGLANVKVDIAGPTKSTVTTDRDGSYEAKVVAGHYQVEASPEGYFTKGKEFDLKGGEIVSAELLVRKRPKEAIAEISNDMIIVKQSVHFVTGEARLAPDAAAVLDAVVDLLVRNKQVKKLRIEGHTDNVGADDTNLKLSKDRAAAVVEYFVQQGIDPARLSAEGYGASRPIAPNLTRRGREQNRRVEFHIVME